MIAPFQSAFNGSWDYSALSEWQRVQLTESSSVLEAECLLKMWHNFTHADTSSELHCNASWDNLYCWPPTPAGTLVTRNCSDVFPDAHLQYSKPLEGIVRRVCLQDGTWAHGKRSNYRECVTSLKSYRRKKEEDDALFLAVQYMLFVGSISSIVCLGISLSIFYFYRSVVGASGYKNKRQQLYRCDRVTVQAHLMISLILRFILMFIIAEPHIFGHSSSFRDMDILCESILVGFLYSTFSSVSWMFNQGLYLNITLMLGGRSNLARYQLIIYYIIGWGVPALFILIYVIAMLLKEQERCWSGYSKMNEMWILLCPIIFAVVVNGVFLLNILRILLRKVRNSHSRPDASQIKAAAKATVLLFPLLGVNNLLLLYNPGGEYNKYFVALNTFFGSTQGIFVAIVYCFTNKEVWGSIRRSIDRIRVRRSLNGVPGCEQQSRGRNGRKGTIELLTYFPQQSIDNNCQEDTI